jgi:hypothetical protein
MLIPLILYQAHSTESLAAVKAVEFKGSLPVSPAESILIVTALEIIHQRLIIFQCKSLMLVELLHIFLVVFFVFIDIQR